MGDIVIEPQTKVGYWLLHEGTNALADVEENGMRVDTAYCERELERLEKERAELREEIQQSPLGVRWRNRARTRKLNLDNNTQLAGVLYDDMGLEPTKWTESGENGATDEEALQGMVEAVPELSKVLRCRKLKKAQDFLQQTYTETVGGFVHPNFNLHTVTSYRSSCNGPNDQQQPNRLAEQKRIVRRSRIPRKGQFLAEFDYKSLEVNMGCPYHKDKNMIKYVSGAGDMHRDMACEILILPGDNLPKDGRKLIGKGGFVFPEFYGRRWFNTAPAMWDVLTNMSCADGTPVVKHLKTKGIGELGKCRKMKGGRWWCSPNSFYEHVREIERHMWDDVFPDYRDWRENIWQEYQKTGYFDLLTGFRCRGVMDRNQVINFPIQGAAFHVLLYSLIKLNTRLREEGWRTKIIGQIHDSILFDVYPPEWEPLKALAKKIVTEEIPNSWTWINVPLTLEAERTAVNGSWDRMREVVM